MLDFYYLIKLNKKLLKILCNKFVAYRIISNSYWINKDPLAKHIYQTDHLFRQQKHKGINVKVNEHTKDLHTIAYLNRLKNIEYHIRDHYQYLLTKKQRKKIKPLLKEIQVLYLVFKSL